MGVATLLGDAGRMEEGLQFMDKAVEVAKGENSNVYNNLGAYLLRLGQSINLHSSEFLRIWDYVLSTTAISSFSSAVSCYVPWSLYSCVGLRTCDISVVMVNNSPLISMTKIHSGGKKGGGIYFIVEIVEN